MTENEMASLIDVECLLPFGKNTLEIKASILDVRHIYGDTQVKLEPIAGNGFAWVSLSSVRMAG